MCCGSLPAPRWVFSTIRCLPQRQTRPPPIPRWFRGLTPDDSDGVQTRQRVAQAVKRFQPAGVEVRVEFEDDRWVMGGGTLHAGDLIDPIVQLRSGTMLWPAP